MEKTMNKEDKQDMIATLNEQMGYIMDLEKYMGTIPTPGLKDILECNKLMMEIIDPSSYKLVKLFDKDEA
jgi:hypothetical protein